MPAAVMVGRARRRHLGGATRGRHLLVMTRHARTLAAMSAVPREWFVEPEQRVHAYDDRPLPIGNGQTISQPYVVAFMIEQLTLRPHERVLEVGTGSGYAAAVLAQLVREVVTVERWPALAERARRRLEQLPEARVRVEVGDGSLGFSAAAPYDAILLSAAAPQIADALLAQLAPGGRLLGPVGRETHQDLIRIDRHPDGRLQQTNLGAVRFVPLLGAGGWPVGEG